MVKPAGAGRRRICGLDHAPLTSPVAPLSLFIFSAFHHFLMQQVFLIPSPVLLSAPRLLPGPASFLEDPIPLRVFFLLLCLADSGFLHRTETDWCFSAHPPVGAYVWVFYLLS